MHRDHKIKLDPTQEQAIYFARACGVARFAFNWALAAWKEEYEAGGKPNEAALRKRLNAIKAEQFPWMSEVTKVAPQNAIKNVGVAFKHFFRRVKQGGQPGYPRFKRKGVRDSFRADNGPVNASCHAVECPGKTVKLPKCGVVRMREPLRFAGRTRAATDAGFAEFRRQLTYKATMTGSNIVVVDRFFPSSKTCHSCGTIHPMKLSDRVMVCDCGNIMDRDLNAAINLKNKAASSAVSACGEESSGHCITVTKLSSAKQEIAGFHSNVQTLSSGKGANFTAFSTSLLYDCAAGKSPARDFSRNSGQMCC